MKIDVIRTRLATNYTIGKMYINDVFFCDTLEDTDRGLTSAMSSAEITAKKIKAQTAIPTGHYNVIMTMSNRFKKILPELVNVKGFAGVRIHSGNTENDTEGCILVGKRNGGTLIMSRDTYKALAIRIDEALSKNEAITIEIKRESV